MARSEIVDSVNQSIGSVTFNGSWAGQDVSGGGVFMWFKWGYASFNFTTPQRLFFNSSGSWSESESVNKDRAAKVRAVSNDNTTLDHESVSFHFKTFADAAVFNSGLFPGTPTTTECPVSGSVTPNIIESTAVVIIQYRKQGTSIWIDGATVATLAGGVGLTALGGMITGLDPGTAYEARYRITRTTTNDTIAFSNIGTFTTQSATPVIVGVPLIKIDVRVFPPTAIAGSLSVTVPLIEVAIEVFPPSISISQARVIQLSVIMADRVETEAVMD